MDFDREFGVHDQLHPLPLASAARFRIRHAYPVSFVIEANGYGYAQGPFWLPWRFALVGQGNQIEDVRFFFSPFSPLATPPLWPPKREDNTCLYREADENWKYRMGGNLTIFDKDHDTAGSRRFLQPSIRLRYNYYVQLVATRRDWECKILERSPKGGVKLVVHITVHPLVNSGC